MMEDPSRRSKRAKTGSRLEEENAALRAALQASREETKAARDGERTALEEVAALKAELFARRRADERRSWLKKHGFDPDDVRKTKKHAFFYIDHNVVRFTPMMWACKLGDIEMCRNLFGSEAAADISTMASNGSSPMCISSQEGHLSVCKWLFEVGAAADIAKVGEKGATPMWFACHGGHLPVCEWLFEVGAASDITKVDEAGSYTPMLMACSKGHLSVCKWLFEVGAAADITKVDNHGQPPMHIACRNGHLSMCKWLFEVGAVVDITKVDNHGHTPMFAACLSGHLSVCKWLFEVGATADSTEANNDGLTPMRAACRYATCINLLVLKGALTSNATYGHTDNAVVRRDILDADQRTALLGWAMDRVAANKELQRTVLVGALSPQKSAYLWKLSSLDDATNKYLKQLVADFAGVPYERELRNVREAAEELTTILNEEESDSEDDSEEEDGDY
jgi:ankyrin repeat protein